MNRLYFYPLIFIHLFVLNGCGLAVVSAVSTARGGENDLYIVDSVQDLSSFSSLDLNQFTGGTNERLTPELLKLKGTLPNVIKLSCNQLIYLALL
jgi:hypothetical protein